MMWPCAPLSVRMLLGCVQVSGVCIYCLQQRLLRLPQEACFRHVHGSECSGCAYLPGHGCGRSGDRLALRSHVGPRDMPCAWSAERAAHRCVHSTRGRPAATAGQQRANMEQTAHELSSLPPGVPLTSSTLHRLRTQHRHTCPSTVQLCSASSGDAVASRRSLAAVLSLPDCLAADAAHLPEQQQQLSPCACISVHGPASQSCGAHIVAACAHAGTAGWPGTTRWHHCRRR